MNNLSLSELFGQYNDVEVRWNKDPVNPIWVAKDICLALEIKNNRDAVACLEADEKGVVNTDTLGGRQEMTGVTEAGLYRLIFKSRKEGAKAFQRWVFHEVLPSIRKRGYYVAPNQPELPEYEKAVKVADSIAHIQEKLADNPRLVQFLIDQALNTYPQAKNQLTGTPLRGVAEIAEEMGLSVTLQNRSQLGKFVKTQCSDLAQEEKRLCNGTMRLIKCYPDCDRVRDAIQLFFES